MAALPPASSELSSPLSSPPSSLASPAPETPAAPTPAPVAPAPLARPHEKELYSTHSRIYIHTRSTFIHRELPPERRRRDSNGVEIANPFIKKLFEFELLILETLSSKSKIKVPKPIGSGLDENGLAFIEMERWDGIPGDQVGDECRMRDGGKHVDTGECTVCHQKACVNAESYIANVVLPEFERLTSNNTVGPDSPPWGRYHNDLWVRKTSDADGYVFTTWDLTPNHLLFDYETLEVIGIYIWEGSALGPPDFHTVKGSQQEFDAKWATYPPPRLILKHPGVNPRPDPR